jgi:ABC-2 type transport system permease protein
LWFNPNENHQWFNPITELANVITIFCILLPAAAMAREKERGTIEQLMVSPLTPTQILAPKIIAMTIVILIGTALSLMLIVPTLNLPLRGSLFLFFVVTAFYVVTMTGFGILAGTIARTMGQVGMLAMLILLPMIVLSGIFTPLEGKPMWFNTLSALVPLKHYAEITFGIFLKGAGLGILWQPLLWLVLLGSAILALGRWMFHLQFE